MRYPLLSLTKIGLMLLLITTLIDYKSLIGTAAQLTNTTGLRPLSISERRKYLNNIQLNSKIMHYVRTGDINGLKQIGPAVIPALKNFLNSGDPVTIILTLQILTKLANEKIMTERLEDITPEIVLVLNHQDVKIRYNALDTTYTFIRCGISQDTLKRKINSMIKDLVPSIDKSADTMLSIENQHLIQIALSTYPDEDIIKALRLNILGINAEHIKQTNDIFYGLNLEDIYEGSQQLIKGWILQQLLLGEEADEVEKKVRETILPVLKIIQYVEKDLPPIKIITEERLSEQELSLSLLPSLESTLFNYLANIKRIRPAILSQLHKSPSENLTILYKKTFPTTPTICKLLIDLLIGFQPEYSLIGFRLTPPGPSTQASITQEFYTCVKGNLNNAVVPIGTASFYSLDPSAVASVLCQYYDEIKEDKPPSPRFTFFYNPEDEYTYIKGTPYLILPVEGGKFKRPYPDLIRRIAFLSSAHFSLNTIPKKNYKQRRLGEIYNKFCITVQDIFKRISLQGTYISEFMGADYEIDNTAVLNPINRDKLDFLSRSIRWRILNQISTLFRKSKGNLKFSLDSSGSLINEENFRLIINKSKLYNKTNKLLDKILDIYYGDFPKWIQQIIYEIYKTGISHIHTGDIDTKYIERQLGVAIFETQRYTPKRERAVELLGILGTESAKRLLKHLSMTDPSQKIRKAATYHTSRIIQSQI